MTEQQHSITPPPELVHQWLADSPGDGEFCIADYIAAQAARWGADQELEACCEWAAQFNYDDYRYQDELRATRRPKPPGLKEQALEALMRADGPDHPVPALVLSLDEAALIRRALESLPS